MKKQHVSFMKTELQKRKGVYLLLALWSPWKIHEGEAHLGNDQCHHFPLRHLVVVGLQGECLDPGLPRSHHLWILKKEDGEFKEHISQCFYLDLSGWLENLARHSCQSKMMHWEPLSVDRLLHRSNAFWKSHTDCIWNPVLYAKFRTCFIHLEACFILSLWNQVTKHH